MNKTRLCFLSLGVIFSCNTMLFHAQVFSDDRVRELLRPHVPEEGFSKEDRISPVGRDFWRSILGAKHPLNRELSKSNEQLTDREMARRTIESVHPEDRAPLFTVENALKMKRGEYIDALTTLCPDYLEAIRNEEKALIMAMGRDGYNAALTTDYPKNHRSHDIKINTDVLKKLRWVVEIPQKTYELNAPIDVTLSIGNASDQEVSVLNNHNATIGFLLRSIDLSKVNSGEKTKVLLTEEGAHYYGGGIPPNTGYRYQEAVVLKPGEKVTLINGRMRLNTYYELSEPGEYELTFYTRSFPGDEEDKIGEYPKSCTTRFTIEDRFYEPKVEWEYTDSNAQEKKHGVKQ